MKPFVLFTVLALWCVVGAAQVHAATMTVDAAGGGNYTTLAAAVADMNNDLWGEEPHTILVTDNQINPINERISIVRSVTIQNAPGAHPVFVVDQTNLGNAHILYAANEHDITFDGLTFIGNAGSEPSDSDNCLFRADDDHAGRLRLTVRNCLITANNGSNQPVTDYTLDPSSVHGRFYHAVLPYRANSAGPIETRIENCTIAYCTRGVAMYGALFTGGSLTIQNTLFAQIGSNTVLMPAKDYAGIPIVISECAFLGTDATLSDADTNIIYLQGSNMSVTISDAIFRSRWNTVARCEGFAGSTLDMRRITAHVGRQFLFARDLSGTQNFTIHDAIWYYYAPRIAAGALGILPGGNPTVDLANLALFEGRWDSSDGATAMPALQNAISALASPIIEADPLFVRDSLGAADAGMLGWHRLTNTLYDVTNPDYVGKGTLGGRPGAALAGGADHTVVLPSAARNWSMLN